MATNDILSFAGTDTGTNLLTQAEYSSDAQRPIGNQPGIARAKLVNKAMRQSSLIAAGVAQFLANNQATNIVDTLTAAQIATALEASVLTTSELAAAAGAGMVGNTPAGNIASTTVQAALNELDTEKANLSGATFTGPVSSTAGDINLKTNTALADSSATLTAAQLIGGLFTITPTVARVLTTDTAVNIIAAMAGSVDNSNFEISVTNLAAFDVTLSAGAGVTIVGRAVINNGSATWRVRRLTATTVELRRTEGVPNGVGDGQTWQNVTVSRALATTYTNSTGRPIVLNIFLTRIAFDNTGWKIVINGAAFMIVGIDANSGGSSFAIGSCVIPTGATYNVDNSSLIGTITAWHELR